MHGPTIVKCVLLCSTALAAFPAGAAIQIERIEAIQVLQDSKMSVRLIAGKLTLVRVFAKTENGRIGVQGRLNIATARDTDLSPILSTGEAILDQNTPLNLQRGSLGRSLNFLLPEQATVKGDVTISLGGLRDTVGHSVPCSNCNSTQSISFVEAPPLRVRVLRVSYTIDTKSERKAPGDIDLAMFQSWLKRAYPTGHLIFDTAPMISSDPWPLNCVDVNSQVAAIRAQDVARGTDARTHYIALVSNAGGLMVGCAFGIPLMPDPSTVASAPAGPPNSPKTARPVNAVCASNPSIVERDLSFAGWYGGHELAHTFGRAHPGYCHGNSGEDRTSFPYPNGQIGRDDDLVAIDLGDPAEHIPMAILDVTKTYDVMTYCDQPQWVSPYTYDAILRRLIDEDKLVSSTVVASNLAQQEGSNGPSARASPPPLNTSPQQNGNLLPVAAAPAAEPPSAAYPSMTSPKLTVSGVAPSAGQSGTSASGQGKAAAGPAATSGRFTTIEAVVNLSKLTGKIRFTSQATRVATTNVPLTSVAPEAGVPAGDTVLIKLLALDGSVVSQASVPVKLSTDIAPGADRIGLVDAALPISTDKTATALEIWAGDTLLEHRDISAQKPTVAAIPASEMGPTDDGLPIIEWGAHHPDPKARLSYTLEESRDGKTWRAIAVGLKSKTLPLTAEEAKIPRLRVIATDGYNVSDPVVVKSPQNH